MWKLEAANQYDSDISQNKVVTNKNWFTVLSNYTMKSNQSWLQSMARSRVDHKLSACEDVILWKIKMTFVLGWWGWDGGCPVV